MESYPYPVKER